MSVILDWLYPPRCEVCELPLNSPRQGVRQWLCEGCHERMVRIEAPYCQICGESYDGAITSVFQCGNCSETNLQFDFAIAAYEASDAVRELVHRFKYQREIHLRGVLGSLLMSVFEEPRLAGLKAQNWVLVPVPLHRMRRWHREFNQSWELCREISKRTGIPRCHALKRKRATTSQARLTRQQRLKNLRNSFAISSRMSVRNKIQGANVLLVDDVLTTGSTASECARILKREGGAEKVVVISVGRG